MKFSTLAVAGLLLIGACKKADDTSPAAGGSGTNYTTMLTDTRNPGVFRSVRLETGTTTLLQRDERCFVEVHGAANAVDALRTDLENGQLVVRYNPDRPVATADGLQLTVHLPFLQVVTVAGSGKTVVQPGFEDSLEGNVTGTGWLQVLGGPFSFLRFTVTGTGKVDARDAQSKTVDAAVTGTGSVVVKASEKLIARIEGTGTISYYGSPSVTVNGKGAPGLVQLGGQGLQTLADASVQR